MADSEEEVDYMSADFLAQWWVLSPGVNTTLGAPHCFLSVGKDDIRPGLMYSHSSKRQAEMEKKKRKKDNEQRSRFKSVKEVQKERLEEGLGTAISSSNIGFSMLQKMGYTPGTSLGKQNQGRLEPVSVEVKSDRVGLGWQEMIKDHRKKREERKLQKRSKHKDDADPEKFRARLHLQRIEKFIQQDLKKSQRICHQMDSKQDLTVPVELWFWPSYALNFEEEDEEEEEDNGENEDEEDDVEFEPEEQLNILTAYLRSTYCYCIWCCAVYDDERDLKQNCPGPTRADHDDDD
ncbi:G patch domain-containing protein 11 isoform X1 [Procambarus clarkii]|uniref:G patch domain-containing protein 11 isoform X1 n=1 Tax=Procambarus clarkii TaxID=6728 RepID=UPI001E670D9C|nr:G patch domain-containing protein 11-like isoform X1 [Procambarus clarkii]